MKTSGLPADSLEMTLQSLREFAEQRLPVARLLQLDHADEFPVDDVRALCDPNTLGIQLVFIPEEYGGFGGSAWDVYRTCELMAAIDLGVATGVLATFLGSDPISFGGTEEQKKHWLGRIAEEGLLFAYGATEPAAGSDLGALKTTATPVVEDGKTVGYRINGAKQWISNGGYADVYTILANTPAGPTWFILEKGAEGFSHGKPEDKHGLRASNTAALSLSDVYVPVENLVGGVEGQGLLQAQLVFGYTRLMVAAFGLGAGWAALDRAIPYSKDRLQGGAPLSEKQGYTHKLIVPHAVRLEAGRAYIEETAERLDSGEEMLNTEGAIAKYLATEAGLAAAEASIQALGGYGYTRDFPIERACRDVGLGPLLDRLPDGLDTRLTERGGGLSVGEKQLVSFARALARDPRILILDEATSSVDPETEAVIERAVDRLLSGRTSVVVAHRLSTIVRADRILVLSHGEVRESGTHAELLAKGGLYARLYALQLKDREAAA